MVIAQSLNLPYPPIPDPIPSHIAVTIPPDINMVPNLSNEPIPHPRPLPIAVTIPPFIFMLLFHLLYL